MVGTIAAILIAAWVSDTFDDRRAWTLVAAVAIGYMISRGLAKSGSKYVAARTRLTGSSTSSSGRMTSHVPRGRIAILDQRRSSGTTDPHELAASLGAAYAPRSPSRRRSRWSVTSTIPGINRGQAASRSSDVQRSGRRRRIARSFAIYRLPRHYGLNTMEADLSLSMVSRQSPSLPNVRPMLAHAPPS